MAAMSFTRRTSGVMGALRKKASSAATARDTPMPPDAGRPAEAIEELA
jgi:hypothetical protein